MHSQLIKKPIGFLGIHWKKFLVLLQLWTLSWIPKLLKRYLVLVVCMFSPSADTCFLDCQVVLSCSISLQVKALKDFFDMLSNVSSYFLNILNRVIVSYARYRKHLSYFRKYNVGSGWRCLLIMRKDTPNLLQALILLCSLTVKWQILL